MTRHIAPQTIPVPASHLDLLTRPICGVLTTMGVMMPALSKMPNGNTSRYRNKKRRILTDRALASGVFKMRSQAPT
jgi:hypothetical protein